MSVIIEFLNNAWTHAVVWTACAVFAVIFAMQVKKMSIGKDTGTKAWSLIAAGILIYGIRVAWKILFPAYE